MSWFNHPCKLIFMINGETKKKKIRESERVREKRILFWISITKGTRFERDYMLDICDT